MEQSLSKRESASVESQREGDTPVDQRGNAPLVLRLDSTARSRRSPDSRGRVYLRVHLISKSREAKEGELTFDISDRREVEMNGNRHVRLFRIHAQQDEFPTRIHRRSNDGSHSNPLSKRIILPRQSLVERISDMIRRILVVDEKEDRSLISILPDMSILVHFLPRESSISSEERIGVGIGGEVFSDVTDGEHETRGGGRGVGRARILSFSVPVDL